MDQYNDLLDQLKPRCEARASESLRSRLDNDMRHMRPTPKRRPRRRLILSLGATAITAAAILAIILLPHPVTATRLLQDAITSLTPSRSIEMEVDVRTYPMENFSFIDLNAPFVTHRINILSNDTLLRWRVDKGGRVAAGTGSDSHVWIPSLGIGWHVASRPSSSLDYLATLLTPDRILEAELSRALASEGDEYKISRDGDAIRLSVRSMPRGDFANPYMLNLSISESENIRRYTFDASSGALLNASVAVVADGRPVEVLRIRRLSANAPRRDLTALPSDIKFIERMTGGFAGLAPEDVTAALLGSFETWDEEVINRLIEPDVSATYRGAFDGARLLSVGTPFHSGDNDYTFVPYTLLMPDGSTRRHNLTLSQQPDSSWLFVGGL